MRKLMFGKRAKTMSNILRNNLLDFHLIETFRLVEERGYMELGTFLLSRLSIDKRIWIIQINIEWVYALCGDDWRGGFAQ